jgi:hypothetical protein
VESAVIVGAIRSRADGAERTRSALLTWAGGSFELTVRGPIATIDATDDSSAHLCVGLPLAMRSSEPLEVEGPVSPQLAARVDDLQAAYRAWNPEWSATEVITSPSPSSPGSSASPSSSSSKGPAGGPVAATGAFFSRGLDSMYTATAEDGDVLVFVDGLEPRHDEVVRKEEIRLAHEAATLVGKPLVVVETNVRALTDRFGTDWEDVLGAGLSFVAHHLPNGLRSMIVPSSDSFESIEPCGSSPLLDPLMSTERMAIAHGSISRTRLGKVRWLAEHHPELLAYLKVCFAQNRPDNCGECGKCLHTMVCLHAAGVLPRASQFPPEVDVERVRALRLPHVKARLDWSDVARQLPTVGPGARLRSAVLEMLEASNIAVQYRPQPDGRWVPRRWTRDNRLELVLSLVLEGRPAPPLDGRGDSPSAPDRLEVPDGDRPGRTLGRLVEHPLPGAVPVWLAGDGTLLTRGLRPPERSPLQRLASVIRRVVARVRSRSDVAPAPARDKAPTISDDDTSRAPAGYLHQRGDAFRVPLYAGWSERWGRQVLGTDAADVRRRGGTGAILLGHLDAPTSRRG